ncbi:Mediator of RNA polymerase II transcription subunit 15 [Dirofilaria immitis]|nr:Mediator of RNA polymerase II transcription subunit 15 [Dirofilaria immitis]
MLCKIKIYNFNKLQQQSAVVATSLPSFSESNRAPATECSGVEDLYIMDDFLPTPIEAIPNSTSSQAEGQLPEAVRQELLAFGDPSHNVPPLQLIIPKTYPNGEVLVGRAALDLDSFFFDDLQNVIHERLARPGLRTVTDFLETWESTVLRLLFGTAAAVTVTQLCMEIVAWLTAAFAVVRSLEQSSSLVLVVDDF